MQKTDRGICSFLLQSTLLLRKSKFHLSLSKQSNKGGVEMSGIVIKTDSYFEVREKERQRCG